METKVSPKNIEERVEAMTTAASEKPIETPEVKSEEKKVETPEVKAEEKKPEVKADEKKPEAEEKKTEVKAEEKKSEVKVEEKKTEVKVEKKKPNDPDELRKWSTKVSQENASLREELEQLKSAVGKLSKKPVDYAALAKDPEALAKHVEAERQEAAKEVESKLVKERDERVKSETELWRERYERSAEHPRWNKLFPLIQSLAANTDGRINFNRPPKEVLHDLYTLAEQLSPAEEAAVSVEEPKMEEKKVEAAPVAPAVPVVTEEQIQARIEEARKKAFEEAQAALRNEENGAGIGSAGKGGRRNTTVSKEVLMKMPREELKKMIQQ